MFHLNDHHVSDSSYVPKMAVVHNLPSFWYSPPSFAQILVTGSRKLWTGGEGCGSVFCKWEWQHFVVFLVSVTSDELTFTQFQSKFELNAETEAWNKYKSKIRKIVTDQFLKFVFMCTP